MSEGRSSHGLPAVHPLHARPPQPWQPHPPATPSAGPAGAARHRCPPPTRNCSGVSWSCSCSSSTSVRAASMACGAEGVGRAAGVLCEMQGSRPPAGAPRWPAVRGTKQGGAAAWAPARRRGGAAAAGRQHPAVNPGSWPRRLAGASTHPLAHHLRLELPGELPAILGQQLLLHNRVVPLGVLREQQGGGGRATGHASLRRTALTLWHSSLPSPHWLACWLTSRRPSISNMACVI